VHVAGVRIARFLEIPSLDGSILAIWVTPPTIWVTLHLGSSAILAEDGKDAPTIGTAVWAINTAIGGQ
jgi:hypothetical protein